MHIYNKREYEMHSGVPCNWFNLAMMTMCPHAINTIKYQYLVLKAPLKAIPTKSAPNHKNTAEINLTIILSYPGT